MSLEEERRRHGRVAVQQIVSLTSSTCTGDRGALTEDISLGGVLVRTNSCVAEGAEVSLVVVLPAAITRTSEVNVLCRGRVLRREDHRTRAVVAVEFSDYELLPQFRRTSASAGRLKM
jgi:c-di-GMP-binding flagellar brake protein YcgR